MDARGKCQGEYVNLNYQMTQENGHLITLSSIVGHCKNKCPPSRLKVIIYKFIHSTRIYSFKVLAFRSLLDAPVQSAV